MIFRMHIVVLDEADLLLSGGFERDVSRILDNMKQNDKERQAQCLCYELGTAVEDFQGLPRHVKAAGFEGGPVNNPLQQLKQPSCSVITGLSNFLQLYACAHVCTHHVPQNSFQGIIFSQSYNLLSHQ